MDGSLPRIGRRSVLSGMLLTGGMAATGVAAAAPTSSDRRISPSTDVIPTPRSVRPRPNVTFELTRHSRIVVDDPRHARHIGDHLAEVLRPSTGYPLPVTAARPRAGDVVLRLDDRGDIAPQGYRLDVDADTVAVRAADTDGLFNGVQTVRQLLPAKSASRSVQPGPWPVTGCAVADRPRFGHRAAMLDVARHFFSPEEVKRYIDQIALYKVNVLHLHLSDDQGWRIEIDSWPRLTEHGGSTEVDGGPGGFYTKRQYREIVEHAASRHITVVPEIDMPGHTNAALSSYAELNCDGVAPPLYTGIEVGFSSLCVDKDITYRFVDDVLRELAEMTPGPYLHIGGDEAHSTTEEDYRTFMSRVLPMVERYGKTPVGWHEYAKAEPRPGSVVQYWGTDRTSPLVVDAAARGNRILLSPANKSYLDQKYDANCPLGLDWAGYTDVPDAYGWDPGSHLKDLPEEAVLGVEAPLWSETLETSDHIEYMAFPRLPAVAELGWSAAADHDWASFRSRLAAHGPRMSARGIDFYRAPGVPWPGA